MPKASPTTEHKPWCVKDDHTGSCRTKRGKWDRSTNTWDSDLTDKDRSAIADGLSLWRSGELTMKQAAAYVREHGDTLDKIEDSALLTWNMTQRRLDKMGRSWPITKS